MGRSRVLGFVVCALATMMLAGCEVLTDLIPPTPCTPSIISSFPDTLEPTQLLIELEWRGMRPPDCHTPEFTLLADGSIYYLDVTQDGTKRTMVAHLKPEESLALVQQVLDLGFECLESWNSAVGPDGLKVTDQGRSILQVLLPDGQLRVVDNYNEYANDPVALSAIHQLLKQYRHPEAEPYLPDVRCGPCMQFGRCWP